MKNTRHFCSREHVTPHTRDKADPQEACGKQRPRSAPASPRPGAGGSGSLCPRGWQSTQRCCHHVHTEDRLLGQEGAGSHGRRAGAVHPAGLEARGSCARVSAGTSLPWPPWEPPRGYKDEQGEIWGLDEAAKQLMFKKENSKNYLKVNILTQPIQCKARS